MPKVTTALSAITALTALALTPLAAHAQETGQETGQETEAPVAATAASPAAQPTYDAISYDVNEDRDNILFLDLSNGERVGIRMMPSWAPNHVERVKTLARQGFYDGVIFHRVIDGFMAQTGDPTGTGQGGSQLPDLTAEFNPMPHIRGTVAMARAAEEDSANSQFFIVFYPRFALDKRYTNFGRVIANMDAVDAIQRGEPPENPTRIMQASLASDDRPMPSMQAMSRPVPQTGTEAPAADLTVDDLNAPLDE